MIEVIILILGVAAGWYGYAMLSKPKNQHSPVASAKEYIPVETFTLLKPFDESDSSYLLKLSELWKSEELRFCIKRLEDHVIEKIENGGDGLDHAAGVLWGVRMVQKRLNVADAEYRKQQIIARSKENPDV
jgi:hypothetical protein